VATLMKQFSFSDMNRSSVENYRGGPPKAYGLLDPPQDIHQELTTGLNDIIGTADA
jgi:hypothetical protein